MSRESTPPASTSAGRAKPDPSPPTALPDTAGPDSAEARSDQSDQSDQSNQSDPDGPWPEGTQSGHAPAATMATAGATGPLDTVLPEPAAADRPLEELQAVLGARPPPRSAVEDPYAWPFLAVLATAGAGLVVVGLNHFRRGTVLFSLAICLAALLRAVLPDHRVGLLRVRARWIDVLSLGGLGAVLLVLALVVPPPS